MSNPPKLLPRFAIIELIQQEKIHLLSNRSQEKRDYWNFKQWKAISTYKGLLLNLMVGGCVASQRSCDPLQETLRAMQVVLSLVRTHNRCKVLARYCLSENNVLLAIATDVLCKRSTQRFIRDQGNSKSSKLLSSSLEKVHSSCSHFVFQSLNLNVWNRSRHCPETKAFCRREDLPQAIKLTNQRVTCSCVLIFTLWPPSTRPSVFLNCTFWASHRRQRSLTAVNRSQKTGVQVHLQTSKQLTVDKNTLLRDSHYSLL